ncbi:MAG: hypothetical protein AB7G47_19545 [Mycolicibacterium sp.]|uniref:hypothetical protein n=1 Tax=Mycolicibacterium sp. TaxID=2320850 RepID=UPI003D0EDF91
MSVFGPDVDEPPAVRPVITDAAAWAADVAGLISEHMKARQRLPVGCEPPLVGLAGALLGVRPVGEAASVIVSAMNLPQPPRAYTAASSVVAGFAAAVNRARSAVYDYTENCLFARRSVLIDWGQRGPDPLVQGSDEWETAVGECGIAVAEAESSERRLSIFEQGMLRAIESAEKAAAADDVDVAAIERLTRDVEDAGRRHSRPPEQVLQKNGEGSVSGN